MYMLKTSGNLIFFPKFIRNIFELKLSIKKKGYLSKYIDHWDKNNDMIEYLFNTV